MVKLTQKSNINEKEFPFLAQWDKDMRENHQLYQGKIDATTYHLQRSQRGISIFGEWIYPKFYSKDILELDILRRKQQLGKIYLQEVNSYKQVNPDIADHLNLTFNASFIWPLKGLAVGSGFFAIAHLFNLPYSFRLGLFIVPTVTELALTWGNKTAQFKSIEFMDYLLQYRKSKALLEKNSSHFSAQKSKYEKTIKSNESVQDLYADFVELISDQAPQE